MIRLPSVRISKLTLQNAAALFSLPFYLLARPVLRWLKILRPGQKDLWVLGGHSGRVYADNAAALHRRLLQEGRPVVWIVSAPALRNQLQARGIRVLQRNSWRARVALENAAVLAYSHGFSDLDHCLWPALTPRGLKIHLNHSLNHLKAGQTLRPGADDRSDTARQREAAAIDPFDYLLASSKRERENFLRAYPGADARIILGGGAHLDAFMEARAKPPGRHIVYFPTFRETRAAQQQVVSNIAELGTDAALLRWLEREDFELLIVRHVNAPTKDGAEHAARHPRVRFIEPGDELAAVLGAALLISDYSGMLCDFLALDRPTIFFPFDRAEYLRQRVLYVDYDDFAFGPQVQTTSELATLITSDAFRAMSAFEAKRRYWQAEFFPVLSPTYAERTLTTIDALKAARSGAA